MATLEWLNLAQENILSILEEHDDELLDLCDFVSLSYTLYMLDYVDRRARDKFRKFFEDMTEEEE